MRDSAQRSFVNIARRVQAIVHQQANELREMEEDHGRNPEVFDDLLRIDHGTALIGRLADSISVLGGGRPGRQWPEPVPLYSVLRGAMSRILEYRRIDAALDRQGQRRVAPPSSRSSTPRPNSSTTPRATRPPQTKVHVTATEVQTGIAIEIEDAGVSLSEEARARAEGMLERAKAGVDLQDLGESPAPRPRRRRPALPDVRHADLAARLRVRRCPRRPRRAAATMLTNEPGARPRPRHRRHRRAQGSNSATLDRPQARDQAAPPHQPAQSPAARVHGGRRPRGHRVDGRRAAAAPQPGQDLAQPAATPSRPPPNGPSGEGRDPARLVDARRPTRSPSRRRRTNPNRACGSRRSWTDSRATRTRPHSPSRPTSRPVSRPTTRGTTSDPAASQLRLDAQGSRRRRAAASR